MFPILQLGPLAIQVPGLFLLAGVWGAVTLAERAAPRFKVSPAGVSNMIFYSLVVGIVGARLGYVLQFLDAYLSDPISMLALNPNTLSVPEGLLAALLTALVYGQRNNLPFWSTLDALTPGLAVFMVALAFAHLSSGDAFGATSDVPWAIDLWGATRHPSQLYELVASALSLAVILRMQEQTLPSGMYALAYLSLTAGLRLFLEAFRGDSVLLFYGIRQAQLISLFLLLASLIVMRLRAIKSIR